MRQGPRLCGTFGCFLWVRMPDWHAPQQPRVNVWGGTWTGWWDNQMSLWDDPDNLCFPSTFRKLRGAMQTITEVYKWALRNRWSEQFSYVTWSFSSWGWVKLGISNSQSFFPCFYGFSEFQKSKINKQITNQLTLHRITTFLANSFQSSFIAGNVYILNTCPGIWGLVFMASKGYKNRVTK